MRVAAVIPAYQAQPTISGIVHRTALVIPEVVVVDDGSDDGTGEAAREAGATVVFHDVNRGKGCALRMAGALRKGELVALQADRPRAGGQTVTVDMLGVEVELPLGPAALARAAERPMLPVFTFREGRSRYMLSFHEPVVVRKSDDRARDLKEATQLLATSIEQAIRRSPEQWFCFGDLRGRTSTAPGQSRE